MSGKKGTTIYVSVETRDTLLMLTEFHRRKSMANMANKLVLVEWYRLSPSDRAEAVRMVPPVEYNGEGVA